MDSERNFEPDARLHSPETLFRCLFGHFLRMSDPSEKCLLLQQKNFFLLQQEIILLLQQENVLLLRQENVLLLQQEKILLLQQETILLSQQENGKYSPVATREFFSPVA